mgnify:FL=1
MSSVELEFHAINDCVNQIIHRLGKDLRVAMPLGLGKPDSRALA